MTISQAGGLIALIGAIQFTIWGLAALKLRYDNDRFNDGAQSMLFATAMLLMLSGVGIWFIGHLQWVN